MNATPVATLKVHTVTPTSSAHTKTATDPKIPEETHVAPVSDMVDRIKHQTTRDIAVLPMFSGKQPSTSSTMDQRSKSPSRALRPRLSSSALRSKSPSRIPRPKFS